MNTINERIIVMTIGLLGIVECAVERPQNLGRNRSRREEVCSQFNSAEGKP